MQQRVRLTASHVARTLREIPDPGPPAGMTPLGDDAVAARVAGLLAEKPPGPLCIFAYGSLIWKPGYDFAARRPARAPGWHRQFCIELTGFRGTPETPGLMLALLSGGSCTGLLLEAPEAEAPAAVEAMIRRETPFEEFLDMARWITAQTDQGPVSALVFWAGPRGERIFRGLPLEQAAKTIAEACGHAGSSAEYLHNTVAALEAHGIRDRNLWKLQHLVAEEIESWPEPLG
jgi:cation transport protein ChaC